MFNKKITEIVKEIIDEEIREGDICVDLTIGNGFDTLYLANKVGESGKVYGFDIQEVAINNTKKLLSENEIKTPVTLFLKSHGCVSECITDAINVSMMNLGYLPTGDKSIITKGTETIKAIEGVLSLLAKNGILSVVIYYGHDGGIEEKEAVIEYLTNLNQKSYEVIQLSYLNRKKNAPIMVFVRKR